HPCALTRNLTVFRRFWGPRFLQRELETVIRRLQSINPLEDKNLLAAVYPTSTLGMIHRSSSRVAVLLPLPRNGLYGNSGVLPVVVSSRASKLKPLHSTFWVIL
ncbi:unnamed protein product, partial [Ectocarpus sp. 12 AP-2014]